MRRLLALATGTFALFLAPPAAAGVGYSVQIDQPATAGGDALATGAVTVRARVSGGVGDAEYAAFYPSLDGGWSDGGSTAMPQVGERTFEGSWTTDPLPNGEYQLRVRVWGDVPTYKPDDPTTFATAVISVQVDNAPSRPGGLRVTTSGTALRAVWKAVDTQDREDFLEYRAWVREGLSCPESIDAYGLLGETSEPGLATAALRPGSYCLRVTAVRQSPVSGEISSPLSAPKTIRLGSGGGDGRGPGGGSGGSVGGYSVGSTAPEAPPAAPALAGGEVMVSDGEFGELLPYGSRRIRQRVSGGPASASEALAELGPDPRAGTLAIAGGLLLAVTALHLRRFLRVGKRP